MELGWQDRATSIICSVGKRTRLHHHNACIVLTWLLSSCVHWVSAFLVEREGYLLICACDPILILEGLNKTGGRLEYPIELFPSFWT